MWSLRGLCWAGAAPPAGPGHMESWPLIEGVQTVPDASRTVIVTVLDYKGQWSVTSGQLGSIS